MVSIAASIGLVGVPLGSAETAEAVFSPPENVSRTETFSQAARLAVGPAGVVDVAWEESFESVLFSRSRDGGQTFSSPLSISPSNPDVSPAQIAVATTFDGTVHVSWTRFDTIFGGAEIVHTRSPDGTSFSPVRVVSKIDAVNSYAPAMATTDGLQRVGIAWADVDLSTSDTSIWFRRSTNRGTFFWPRRKFPTAESASCPEVAMMGWRDIYVVWTEGNYPDEEILFSRSTNSGLTFKAPMNISQLAGRSWCPRIAVDPNGIVYVVWEEGDAFVDRRIVVSRSTNRGESFDSPVFLSLAGEDSFCPSLAAAGSSRVYVTWSTGSFSVQTVQTFLSVSSNGGLTFSDPIEIPVLGGAAGCPEIESSEPDRIHLVWNDVPPEAAWPDIFQSVGVVTLP